MSQDDFATLASQLIDGKMSGEQMLQLESYLRDHPEAREVLVQHLFLDSMLTNELGAESVAGLVDMISTDHLTALPTPRAKAAWLGWTLTGVAAAVLLSIGALVYFTRDGGQQVVENPAPKPTSSLAKVEDQEGLQLVGANGEAKAAARGDEVKPGQTLRTSGDEGYALIRSNDTNHVEMIGETVARLIEATTDGSKRFFLSQGVLRVKSGKSEGPKITVTTPHAAIQVEGTFFCSTTPNATYVEVEAGWIKLMRQADGKEVEVTQGSSVVAAASNIEPMIARPATPTMTSPFHTLKNASAAKVAFAADGARLTTFDFRTFRVWDAKTGQLLETCELPLPEFRNAALSANAANLAGSSKGAFLHALRLPENKLTFSLPVGGKELHAIAVSQSGGRIATSETMEFRRSVIRLFDGVSATPGRTYRVPVHQVRAMAFSADQSLLAAGTNKGTIYLVHCNSDKEAVLAHEMAHEIVTVLFAPDGRQLAAVNNGGTVVIWDIVSRNEVHRFQASGRSFLSAAFSPGGRFLAVGTGDGAINLWNVETGAEHLTLKPSGAGVRAIAFSPDGRLLASAASRTTFVWQLPDNTVDSPR